MNSGAFTAVVWSVFAVCAGLVAWTVWRHVKNSSTQTASRKVGSQAAPLRTIKAKSGLQSDILVEGSGAGAKKRDSLTVNFIAWLSTGEKVDSSYDRGRTLTFKLGTGAVIYGWDQALVGMKVGEKRKVTVPAALAYGRKGKDRVPPNSTVIFEVELMKMDPV